MRGEQAIFNLKIKKKSGLSINPDIHHSKVFSSDAFVNRKERSFCHKVKFSNPYIFATIWCNPFKRKISDLTESIFYKISKVYDIALKRYRD